MKIRRRLLAWIAVGFAAAAIVAPTAQGVRAVVGGEGSVSPQTTPTVPASQPTASTQSSDGFSWSDAGVGAAAVLSIVLVAGGGVLVVRGTRRSGLAGA
jgi:hypothetical protein